MGESKDFAKALTEALKDTAVKDMFQSIFNPLIEDLAKELQNKLNVWHKQFVEDIRSELDVLRNNLKAKDDKIVKLENEIESLKCDQDRLEQYTRRNSLRISGVPESEHEDVCGKVIGLCNGKLRIPVKTSDIDRVHRVGRPGTVPRQILVTFSTYGTRTSVFKAKSVLRPGGRHPHSPWTLGDAAGVTSQPAAAKEPPPEEPTTDDDADDDYDEAGLDYSKIYISEDLTRQRQFIFWKCREAKKSKKIRDCWTTEGQINIRDSANKVTPINSLNDLVNIL